MWGLDDVSLMIQTSNATSACDDDPVPVPATTDEVEQAGTVEDHQSDNDVKVEQPGIERCRW